MRRTSSWKNFWFDASPRTRRIVGYLTAPFPTAFLLGRRFRESLRFAQEAQWWSAERTRAYQCDELRRTCALAYEKTRFYRQLFDSVGWRVEHLRSPDDLETLPTIDKTTIRDHLGDMCATPPASRGVDKVSTGGSTGEPLRFYIGASRSAVEYAYLVASWSRIGFDPKTPQAVLRGQIVPEDGTGLRHEYDPILRRHYYSNFHMTEANIVRYLEHIATIGPCFLHVYPSSVAVMARHLARRKSSGPKNILGILAGSETVFPDDRRLVEERFGVRYLSWYGHSEKLVLAAECERSTDYHVWPTYGYCELLDERGRRVTTPGQRGEIVGTGFINTVMPFIRYRTGDFATYVGERCEACGREQMIIRDVRGHRTQEMLVASDQSLVSWTSLNMHDDTFDRVRRFQFQQEIPGRAVLHVVPADGFGETERNKILQNLSRKLDGRLEIQVLVVDAIPLSPRGKAIYVDQRIDLTFLQPNAVLAART